MIEIKDLLLRFNNLLLSEEIKKNSVADTLYGVVGLRVKLEDIKIKNNTVYLNIKPIYKNEIFLKKDKIDLKLEENLGRSRPRKVI